jgi:hypothetical protein
MTPLEDKLRIAFRQTGLEIPPSAPPLRLNRSRHQARWRWRAWTAPVAAAVLVGVVIAGSLALTSGTRSRAGLPGAGQLAAVPPYFVTLITPAPDDFWATTADIRATATGATIASATPPRPYTVFSGVTAADDDRTFVLAAKTASPAVRDAGKYPPERLYVLRLHPDGTIASLRALAMSDVPAGEAVQSIALSPDGTRLAAVIEGSGIRSKKLSLFDLTTGTERTWTAGACVLNGMMVSGGEVIQGTLSWTADGRYLAFGCVQVAQAAVATVRLLDTSARGPDLVAGSRPVVTDNLSPLGVRATVTPDGRWIVVVRPLGGTWPEIEKFPVRPANRAAARILPGRYTEIMWTSPDGSVLILFQAGRPGGAVIVSDGRQTPIPGQIGATAW